MAKNKARYMARDENYRPSAANEHAENDPTAPSEYMEFQAQAALVKTGEQVTRQIDMAKHVPARLYHVESRVGNQAAILNDIQQIVANQIERYKANSALSTFNLRETSALKNLVLTYTAMQEASQQVLGELNIDKADADVIEGIWQALTETDAPK